MNPPGDAHGMQKQHSGAVWSVQQVRRPAGGIQYIIISQSAICHGWHFLSLKKEWGATKCDCRFRCGDV